MKNFLKISLLITSVITTVPLNGQDSSLSDTINIKEVIITRKQIGSVQPGFRIVSIDSAVLKNYSLLSLADILNETTPLFMKYYGSGGTSTPSFRGTSAGHTIVMWNGININDNMLGQSDFSLLPAGMIDNLKISFGGASMDLGDGAIGAIINLENEPQWTKHTLAELNPGTGSFGRSSGLVKVNSGTEKFQITTKAFMNTAKNNFPYLTSVPGSEPVWGKRENDGILQKGFMQELYLRNSSNVLSARIWYQSASRNLPGSTLWGYSGEKQTDESIRSLVNYDIVKEKSEYFIAAAWMFTKLDYTSNYSEYNSKNRTNTIVLKGGMTASLGEYTKLKMILNDEVSAIRTNKYAAGVTRNLASVTLSAERRKGDRFGTVVLFRETLNGTTLILPDFSAGLEFRIRKGEDHYIKWNVSRNSKIPAFNDRYWNPGGNPDIKNEYAYSAEIGYSFIQKMSPALTVSFDMNIFKNYIRDMIQWRPLSDTSFIYIADNIGSVNTSGFESSLSMKYRINHFQIDFKAAYSYTRASEIKSKSSQLIYIPENQANGLLRVGYKNLYSAWVTDFTGIVYTKADNSEHLSGYTINNLITGFKINLKENLIDIHFKVENLFNVSYQTIAYYPQPGRSYYFTLLFQIRK